MNTRKKRVALIAAVLVLLALTACSIPAVREVIVKFFWEEHEGYSEMILTDEGAVESANNESDGRVFDITELPEGFRYTSTREVSHYIEKTYLDKSGILLVFSQTAPGTSGLPVVDNESSEIAEKIIDGNVVNFLVSDTNTSAFWMIDGYQLELDYYGVMALDSMAELIKTIQ